jgi:3alpha(or 20beta)-hydroxysteroid dehydrogenase
MFAYAASKWAVRGLTKCAAADLAPLNIRVNSIYPGLIDTPMIEANGQQANDAYIAQTPLKRIGTADEIADLVAFLVSDEARYITGAEIAIDGGMSL